MDDPEWLANRFEEHRAHLRAVAYRMLGSLSEADDAVQDTWMRVSRAGAGEVENLSGWRTTIVAHVCLNVLAHATSRARSLWRYTCQTPVISPEGYLQPEEEALLADSVRLALQVVVDTLARERLVFLLHGLFGLPFEEIAPSSPRRKRQGSSPAGHGAG